MSETRKKYNSQKKGKPFSKEKQITKKEQPAKKRRKKETACTESMAGDGGNLFTDLAWSLWD